MSSAADYVGRTVDLVAFGGADAAKEKLLVQDLALPGGGGQVCTGVQKLAQRWLVEFMTELGSMPYLPARGCIFMSYFNQGLMRTTLDASQIFNMAAQQIESNLMAEETGTEPDDERLAAAVLTSMTLSGDKLTLYVEVWSRAGTSRSVILPINTTIG